MRRFAAVVAVISALTLIRVASTHRVFSPTFDEPIHVLAGYLHLTKGDYRLDPEHPPMARMFFALPFRNVKVSAGDDHEREMLLYLSTGDYLRGVARSRRGNLVFLAIALVAIAFWARDLFGTAVGITACAIFAMLPPILAHAGLATTDMAGTAGYCAAMFSLYRWIDRPTLLRTSAFGLAVGLALVTKFSLPLFFATSLVIVMIARRRAPLLKGSAAFALSLLVIWGVYRFEFQELETFKPDTKEMAVKLFGSPWLAVDRKLPAPGFVTGLMMVALHNRRGHPAYFMGQASERGGWWSYFPVVFAIKTPLPFMILAAAGAFFLIRGRQHRELIVLPVAIMAASMTSNINIGLRHILPIYAPLSILAAIVLIKIACSKARLLAIGLAGWLVIGSLAAHPDYLPWANAFGGGHPERIAIDSNFDWGQDVVRLRTACRRLGIRELGGFLFGTTDLEKIGLPPVHGIEAYTSSTGWIAVSESAIVRTQAYDPVAFYWLTSAHRYERIGKTIRLYHVTN